MNYLLSLNKRLVITLGVISFFSIIIFFLFNYLPSNNLELQEIINQNQTSDILKPKFSINSKKQKIFVTANEGNFLTQDEIILKKNVIFESENFKIYADNVIFNKKTLVARTDDKSKFVSNNSTINSKGFDIIQNGNIINFKGKTLLLLKWLNFY